MRSSIIVLLSFLLTVAIIAPSVITLMEIDSKKIMLIDFNEEENKKEEKKEIGEKDFLFYTSMDGLSLSEAKSSVLAEIYSKSSYKNLLEVFLPPPETIV